MATIDFNDTKFKKLFNVDNLKKIFDRSQTIRQAPVPIPKSPQGQIFTTKDFAEILNEKREAVACEMEFPLWFGKEADIKRNPVMSYLHNAWGKKDKNQLDLIYQGLGRFQLAMPSVNFSITSNDVHNCRLVRFDMFLLDIKDVKMSDTLMANGLISNLSPFKVRIQFFGGCVDKGEWLLQGGYFYVTGDLDLEYDSISGFDVVSLNYYDKHSNQINLLLNRTINGG